MQRTVIAALASLDRDDLPAPLFSKCVERVQAKPGSLTEAYFPRQVFARSSGRFDRCFPCQEDTVVSRVVLLE